MTRLFIDMDGVLADFDGHYTKLFGETPEESDKQHKSRLWNNINGHMGEFFAELPKMPGVTTLLQAIRYLHSAGKVSEVYILTAAGDSTFEVVSKQKRKWLAQHISDNYMVLTTRKGVDKAAFVQKPGDVLIDDMQKNCDAWEAAGGTAVHYTSLFAGLTQLSEKFYYDADIG